MALNEDSTSYGLKETLMGLENQPIFGQCFHFIPQMGTLAINGLSS